jgi:hypothetical protein
MTHKTLRINEFRFGAVTKKEQAVTKKENLVTKKSRSHMRFPGVPGAVQRGR